MDVLMLVLGWLFGLLSPAIVDAIKKRYRNKEIRRAIISELDEARFFLASNVYVLSCDRGIYDRNLLNWILPIFDSYRGSNPASEIARQIRAQVAMSDEHIAMSAQNMKQSAEEYVKLKKRHVSYLQSRLTDLGSFNEKQQALLFDIHTSVVSLN